MNLNVSNDYYKAISYDDLSEPQRDLYSKLPVMMRVYELSTTRFMHLADVLKEIYNYAAEYPLENNASFYSDPCVLQEYIRSLVDLGFVKKISCEEHEKLLIEEIEDIIDRKAYICEKDHYKVRDRIRDFLKDQEAFVMDRYVITYKQMRRLKENGVYNESISADVIITNTGHKFLQVSFAN